MDSLEWNSKYPKGTAVIYRSVKGDKGGTPTVTRSEAWDLPSGETIVLIEGKAGGVSVEALTATGQAGEARLFICQSHAGIKGNPACPWCTAEMLAKRLDTAEAELAEWRAGNRSTIPTGIQRRDRRIRELMD